MSEINIYRIFGLDPDNRYSKDDILNFKNKKISFLSNFTGLEYDSRRLEINNIDEKKYTSEVQDLLAEEERKRLSELEIEFCNNISRQLKLLEKNITDYTFFRIADSAYKWPISAEIEMPIFVKYILQHKTTTDGDLELLARRIIINKIKEFVKKNGIMITGDPSSKQLSSHNSFSISNLTNRKKDLCSIGKIDFYDFLGISSHSFSEVRFAIDKELELVHSPKYTKNAEATQRRRILFSINNVLKTEEDIIFYNKEIEYAKLLHLITLIDNACRTAKVISNNQFNTLIEEGLKEGVDKQVIEEFIYSVANERKYFVDSSEQITLMCATCGMPCPPVSAQNPKCLFCKNELSPVVLDCVSQRNQFLQKFCQILKKNIFLSIIFLLVIFFALFSKYNTTSSLQSPIITKTSKPSEVKVVPNDVKNVPRDDRTIFRDSKKNEAPATPQRFRKIGSSIILDTKNDLEWIVNSDKGISWFVLEAWVAQLNEFHGRGWEIPSLKQLATLMNSGNFTAQCTRRSKNTSLGTENTGHVTTIYLNEIFSKGCGNVWSSDDKDGDTQYYYMFSSGEKAETPVMDCGTDCPQAFAVRKHSGK